MSIISIQNITVKNQQHALLHNLSLNINQGEHWLLVGASGSGKTVLLNTLAGRLRPVSGIVDVANEIGKSINLVTSKHHFTDKTNTSTNMYYQQRFNSSDSDQALSVLEYLESKMTSAANGCSWTVKTAAELLQLNSLLNKELIKLSNGETKRLKLASALLLQPKVLLLDDPLSGLDQQTQKNFNQILNAIIESGVTIIMSGSAHEIPSAITHVAVLESGTIVRSMPISEFQPETATTSNLINKVNIEALTAGTLQSAYEWIVKMSDVTVRYGEHTILNKVNWQIKAGDRWALFGHNGAGKSTLLSLINGDNPQAYANNIILFDKKRGTGESIWDIKSKIGFLSPELYQYFPTDQSGFQVIESGYYDTQGLFRPSNPARAAKALEWMKALHIDKYANMPLKSMPASVQRLCLLARAIIKTPPLLILDEPCQGLDKEQRLHFNELVEVITETTGLALIYVTHYVHEMPSCIDNILTLKNGEVADTI
jgi:molybdate transport system ATP-binding protein